MDVKFVIEDGKLLKYNGSEVAVMIPEEVVFIGAGAFEKNGTLQMLILNEGLQAIDTHAFFECKNLQSIHFPSTLKKIGRLAFESCESLGMLSLPEGIEVIEDMAFAGCSSLRKVRVQGTVRGVSFSAFPAAAKIEQSDTQLHAKKCPNCGAEVEERQLYCTWCGVALMDQKEISSHSGNLKKDSGEINKSAIITEGTSKGKIKKIPLWKKITVCAAGLMFLMLVIAVVRILK